MQPAFAQKLKKSLWLGLISSAVTLAYLGHNVTSSWKPVIEKETGGPHAAFSLFLAEFTFATFSIFVCAAVGFFLARRYNLPGEGDVRELPPMIKWYLLAGIVALPLGYFMHDRIFIAGSVEKGWPEMVPTGIGWCFAYLAYGVLFKEVIFRFGILTLFAGLFLRRHPWWAVGGTAAFAAGLSMRELGFAGYEPGYDLVTFSTFAWALLINAALGAVCIKKGLYSAMALRACVDSRIVFYSILNYFSIIQLAD